MSPRPSAATVVARFIVEHGAHTSTPPPRMSVATYRKQLAALVKRGVLRIWAWDEFRPEPPGLAGRYLYVDGPKWESFCATVEKSRSRP